jgi:hypothetical protein
MSHISRVVRRRNEGNLQQKSFGRTTQNANAFCFLGRYFPWCVLLLHPPPRSRACEATTPIVKSAVSRQPIKNDAWHRRANRHLLWIFQHIICSEERTTRRIGVSSIVHHHILVVQGQILHNNTQIKNRCL